MAKISHRFFLASYITAGVLLLGLTGMFFDADAASNSFKNEKEKNKPEIFIQLGHSSYFQSVAISPDDRYVLTGGYDRIAKLWDISTGREIRSFSGHTEAIFSLSFSPDSRYLITVSMETAKLWDIATGREIRSFNELFGPESSVMFSPDGRYVLIGRSGVASLWNASTGEKIRSFRGHRDNSFSAAFSPDGRHLIIGLGIANLWDVSTWEKGRSFIDHKSSIKTVSFSPDGRYLMTGSWSIGNKLWDIATGREIRSFTGESDSSSYVAFSPDSRHVLTDADGHIKLSEVSTGKEIRVFKVSSSRGHSLMAFSSNGRNVITGSILGRNKLWNISTGKEIRVVSESDRNRTLHTTISPSGRYVITENKGTPVLWDMSTGEKTRSFKRYSKRVNSVAISTDGRYLVTGSGDNTAKLWDISTGRTVRSFKGHSSYVSSVAISTDGRYLVTGSGDNTAKLWDIATGREIRSFKGHTRRVVSATFSPNGRYVITGSADKTVKLWDVTNGKEIRFFKHKRWIESVAVSTDGRNLITCGADGTAKLWDISTGREIISFKDSYLRSASISPDGRYVITAGKDLRTKEDIKLWDVSTGKQIRSFKGNSNTVLSTAISPDGRYLLTGSDDHIAKLWDIFSGREIRSFKGHLGEVSSVEFSLDGRYVITASHDSSVKIWSLKNGEEICQFISFIDGEWIAFIAEGFYNASNDGAKYLNVRNGNKVYSIDQFHNALYRADLVQAKLTGDPERLVAEAASKLNLKRILAQGSAPKVKFLSPQPGISKIRDLTINAAISDTGGGFGKIVWKLNGQTIGIEKVSRAIKVVPKTSDELFKISRQITLSPGKNLIELVAYNKSGGMASDPSVLNINLKDAISEQPSLYILAIGINKYRDKSLWLSYAVPDAIEIANRLQHTGQNIFKKIHQTELHDQNATLSGIQQSFAQIAEKDQTNDVFILYIAGHGVTLDGRYHFLPADFRYRNEDSIRQTAINQDHLQKWLANLDSRKSLVHLDTCNSGSFTEAQAITRGISEKTAIDKLTRATGRATIAASMDSQVAFEGYKGHGVFTYALIQALSLSDQMYGNKDNVTTTSEIANFIDEFVPNITYKQWGYEQVPQVNLHGRTFPIGVVK